jgi:TonB-dependent SusC/RagA subfamily outer membrane receptor
VSGIVTNDDAYAQQNGKTISGIVRNEKGEPLSGATVNVKGTSTTTVTDDNGKYTITVPSSNSVLVISYVGMLPYEQKVGTGPTLVNISLASAGQNLNEIVVVGYGKQKKTTLTGSVEQISGKTFESRAVTNIGLALQGETPGLLVTRTSPRPGNEGLDFVIRGQSSVNGSAPLIIVDGVPVLNSFSFLNMNADDIESISILKDASAAIYGSAAANGVILVTTKRGRGKTKYDFSSNMRFTTNGITGYSPSMQEYATTWIEANKEETNPNWWVWGSKDNMLKMQQGVEGAYPLFGIDYFIFNANRIKEMFATRYS